MTNQFKGTIKYSFYNTLFNFLIVSIILIFLMGCQNPINTEKPRSKWQFYSQREALAPTHWIDEKVLFDGKPTLALAGDNKEYTNGHWTYTYNVVPNNYYEFNTFFKSTNLKQVDRSVFAQITWLSGEGKRVEFIEFPAVEAKPIENNWFQLHQTYLVPKEAVKAKIDLVFRWSDVGTVYFGGTSLIETNAISPRKVRLAAIHHKPRNTSSSLESLEQFKDYIELAGEQKADIICLPEGATVVGTHKSYLEVSEPIPGPTTAFLGDLAKEYNTYIIAGLYEKEGSIVYNSSVLIGRNGKVQGIYRKVSLPREEVDAGLTPGDDFPVFETDFGKIGMMICWDSQFPEAARMLSLKGAEVIFLPIWGGNTTLVKARAIENQVFIVSSSYDMESGIFNKNGELIAEGTEENPVAIIDVDLNKRNLIPWLGEFKNRIKRELPKAKVIQYQ